MAMARRLQIDLQDEVDLYDHIGQNGVMTFENEKTVSLADAKAHFAECVRGVEKGQSIGLTRHGRPVARLVPLAPSASEGDAEWSLDGDRRQQANEVRERLAEYEPRPTASLSNPQARRAALQRLLEGEIWPQIPREMVGRGPTRKEREEILGIREDGT